MTAVHAQHGPDGSDEIQGPVLGFVLSAPGADPVYVSGDNASRDVVRAIVEKTARSRSRSSTPVRSSCRSSTAPI